VTMLPSGRQLAIPADRKGDLLYSTFFRIVTMEGTADFSELNGITSEVEHTEYMEAGPVGSLFSRHAGRTKAPTVSLKRAMRTGLSTTWIWTWHKLARMTMPGMLRDCTLMVYGAGDDPDGIGRMTYVLVNSFPAKVELTGMKAGATELILQSVTLQCDDIIDMAAF
jgi:phage tail-like protein